MTLTRKSCQREALFSASAAAAWRRRGSSEPGRRPLQQTRQGLDLSDHFPAGAGRIECLIKEPEKGAAQAENAPAAVGPGRGGVEPGRRQERPEQKLQGGEAFLTQTMDAAAQGGQARAPWGEEGRVHNKYIYLLKA